MGQLVEAETKFTKAANFIRDLTRIDSWSNPLTNLGVFGKDKAASTRVSGRRSLGFAEIDALYRLDGIAADIVDEIVEDALRCGWKIEFASDDEDGVDPEKVKEINGRILVWEKKNRFRWSVSQHLMQSRAYGGSLLVLGADDGGAPFEELNPESMRSMTWARALDRYQVSPSGQVDPRPDSPFFSFPLWYHLSSPAGPVTTMTDVNARRSQEARESSTQLRSLSGVQVHASRVWRTDGDITSDRTRMHSDGWGESVLERAYEPIRAYSSTMINVETIVQDFTQGVYGIKGLRELISSGNSALVLERFRLMDRAKSIVNAITIDADGETYERKTTSVVGLPEIIDRMQLWVSAVSGKPLTKLFGVSPGGFGTGESEGENWDDKVQAFQDDKVRPLLEYVYGLLFHTPEFRDVPDGWSIEFNPLSLESPQQQADTRKTNSEADSNYVVSGVLTPDEVAVSRFSGAKYGDKINLNEEARSVDDDSELDDEARELNAAAASSTGTPVTATAAGADVQKTALNGAQVAELKQMVLDVQAGDLVLESAVAAALFAFPTMSDSEARAMFGPAAEAAERKAKEAPPNIPPPPPSTAIVPPDIEPK